MATIASITCCSVAAQRRRSILAEAVLNKIGAGRFEAHSRCRAGRGGRSARGRDARQAGHAGPQRPAQTLRGIHPTGTPRRFVLRSATRPPRSIAEWPGRPVTAHWSSADPFSSRVRTGKRCRLSAIHERARTAAGHLRQLRSPRSTR